MDSPDDVPARPTVQRLRDAVDAVESAGGKHADDLAGLLLAVDRDGDPGLLAEAERLLVAARPGLWPVLDVAVRRMWCQAPRWSTAAVRRLVDGEPSRVGLAVAAFHPDGHVREVAVAGLAGTGGVLPLPVLVLRAADWASPVRDRARSALEQRLSEPSGSELLAVSAVGLALAGRREGRWLADHIETVLREGPAEALTAALAAPDWRTRRVAYTVALDAGRLELGQMVYAAEHDGDLPTRIRCAEAAVKAALAAGTVDLVRPLLSSGTAMVRVEAIHVIAQAGDLVPAIAALADRNPLVRAVAQAAVRRSGADPADRYRRLVAVSEPAPGAIAGLGETGSAHDSDLIRRWLDHPRPRGRAETVRALRRLDAPDPGLLSAMLTDPSAAVTRQVTAALRPWASRLDTRRLRDLLTDAHPQHVRTAAYMLLRERDIWTRLLVDLELVSDQSPVMRNRARSDLATWLVREAATTYSMPQGPTADALAGRLHDATDVLGEDQVRLLRFHFGLKSQPTA